VCIYIRVPWARTATQLISSQNCHLHFAGQWGWGENVTRSLGCPSFSVLYYIYTQYTNAYLCEKSFLDGTHFSNGVFLSKILLQVRSELIAAG
jgi:hypothetical protein